METSFFHLSGDGLPADILVVGYQAREGVSVPFQVEVDFSTEDEAFVVDACLRKPLLLTVVDAAGNQRVFHGVVDEAAFVQALEPKLYFRLRLRPALAALAHRAGCRIYQNKSVQEIAQSVFAAAGFGDQVEWDLTGTYEPREYVVQYRESELDFVSRLFEDQGIYYFFKHTPEGHSMVVADHGGAFVLEEGAPPVQFFLTRGAFVGGQPLHDVARTRSLRTSSVLLRDYDFEKPDFAPSADVPAEDKWPMAHYEYPGGFTKADTGKQMAAARARQLRHDADLVRGSSRAIGLRIGVPFEIHGAAEPALDGELVVVALETRGAQRGGAGGAPADNVACDNRFTAITTAAPWAPPRRTPRPRIRGV
ncbi:MAG: type VI secretion system tip protein TssI/VgrG, partial [Polyangiaceae bacterium]